MGLLQAWAQGPVEVGVGVVWPKVFVLPRPQVSVWPEVFVLRSPKVVLSGPRSLSGLGPKSLSGPKSLPAQSPKWLSGPAVSKLLLMLLLLFLNISFPEHCCRYGSGSALRYFLRGCNIHAPFYLVGICPPNGVFCCRGLFPSVFLYYVSFAGHT